MRTLAAALVALFVVAGPAPGAQTAPPALKDLLREIAQFTDRDWAQIERGTPVAKVLDTDSREIAVVGAIRAWGQRDRLLEHYRDIEAQARSSAVLAAGRLPDSPTAADFASVPFEEYSLDVRDCRVGECRVRLGAEDLAQFGRRVSWGAPDWREQSAAVWRDVLARYASGYAARGREALPVYVNKDTPLSVASELGELTGAFAWLRRYSPEMHDYLQRFGSALPQGARSTLYWTKEDFSIRPVFRISHQVSYRVGSAPVAIVVVNQVYADHYLDAALSVTVAVEESDGGRPATRVVVVNRARTRSLSGFLRRFARNAVQNRSREMMRSILSGTRAAVEGR